MNSELKSIIFRLEEFSIVDDSDGKLLRQDFMWLPGSLLTLANDYQKSEILLHIKVQSTATRTAQTKKMDFRGTAIVKQNEKKVYTQRFCLALLGGFK